MTTPFVLLLLSTHFAHPLLQAPQPSLHSMVRVYPFLRVMLVLVIGDFLSNNVVFEPLRGFFTRVVVSVRGFHECFLPVVFWCVLL